MKSFRTYNLALQFYRNSRTLKLSGPIRNQFGRAALSIVLNLSEGSAKPGAKDRRRYYQTSLGSLREVQTILEIAEKQDLASEADILGAHIYKLIQGCLV